MGVPAQSQLLLKTRIGTKVPRQFTPAIPRLLLVSVLSPASPVSASGNWLRTADGQTPVVLSGLEPRKADGYLPLENSAP